MSQSRSDCIARYVEVLLVKPTGGSINGPLLECLHHWNSLSGIEWSRSFIIPSEAISGKGHLRPSELSELVRNPEFLSLPS